jgi:hypothetical protein
MVQLTTWQNDAEVDALLEHHGLAPRHGFGDDADKRNAAWNEFVARLIVADAKQRYG